MLGPVLFILYINNLTVTGKDIFKFELFVDDAKATKQLNIKTRKFFCKIRLMHRVIEWSVKWELSLSLKKCIYLQ